MNLMKTLQMLNSPHYPQETEFTCGAASYRKMLSMIGITISEKQARIECKTTSRGTNTHNVYAAFKNRGLPAYMVNINTEWNEYRRWLELNSLDRIIYVSGLYKNRYNTRGRDRINHHAVCTSYGVMFDPGENKPLDYPSYTATFNKSYMIGEIIFISLDEL
jgi:predicted double-glycine peptidase